MTALREPAHLVSPRARVLWTLGAAARMLLLFAIAIPVVWLNGLDVPWPAWLALAALALAYVLVMPSYRYRVHRWESTEPAVYTQAGWLSVERRIAPMSRVQTVDLEQSAIGRLFDLAAVTVTTASAAGPLRIEGLDHQVALGLVEELTRRAEAETGDAT